jgi:hypothetical protein
MSLFVERFASGGPFMYLVLLLMMLAVPLVPAYGVVAALRVRLPALVWLLVPALMVAVGVLGRVVGHVQMGEAVIYAAAEQRDALTFAGLAIAPIPEWFALWGAAIALSLSALLAGLGALIGAGKEARWTWAPGIIAAAVGGVGWLGVAGWSLVATGRPDPALLLFPAILLAGGLGIVAAGLRSGTEDRDAQRSAAARALAVALTVLALGAALVTTRMNLLMTLQQLMGTAAPEQMGALFTSVLTERAAATGVGLAAMAVALVAGAIPSVAAIRALLKPYALISAALTVVVLGLLGGLHAIGWYQAHDQAGDTALMRSQELAETVTGLPQPPASAAESRVVQLDGAMWWNGAGWSRLTGGVGGTEMPSMAYGGPQRGLLALEATTPARVLVDSASWEGSRESFPQEIEILTDRPPTGAGPSSPYLDWTRLGAVEFLWLAGGASGPLPLDGSTGASEWIEEPLPQQKGSKSRAVKVETSTNQEIAEAAGILAVLMQGDTGEGLGAVLQSQWPPIEESIYVLDGAGAPGAIDLGIPTDSDGIWVIAVNAAPREIARGDEAARQLAEAVEVLDRPYLVFLPADRWTVQDLITLCLTAVPPSTSDPYGYWGSGATEIDPTCAVDAALPLPEHGPRLQGLP